MNNHALDAKKSVVSRTTVGFDHTQGSVSRIRIEASEEERNGEIGPEQRLLEDYCVTTLARKT